jgi:hypothetical protein
LYFGGDSQPLCKTRKVVELVCCWSVLIRFLIIGLGVEAVVLRITLPIWSLTNSLTMDFKSSNYTQPPGWRIIGVTQCSFLGSSSMQGSWWFGDDARDDLNLVAFRCCSVLLVLTSLSLEAFIVLHVPFSFL